MVLGAMLTAVTPPRNQKGESTAQGVHPPQMLTSPKKIWLLHREPHIYQKKP